MKFMKWISNTAKKTDLFNVPTLIGQTREEALRYYQNWRSQLIEGDRQATDSYSVAELKAMGMIGLYEQENA